jgi:hypothetical protein
MEKKNKNKHKEVIRLLSKQKIRDAKEIKS